MLAQGQLFNSNLIYVYFLSCIVIFNYQHFTKCQKISLIYATTIAMEVISKYSGSLTAVMLLISMFIFEEYLSDDTVKCELLMKLRYKVIDFAYQFLVTDAGFLISVNIILSGKWFRQIIEDNDSIGIYYGLNIALLLVTIHILNTSKFKLFDFGVMKSYFDKFDGKKIELDSPEVRKRFEIMTDLEDKSYFDRTNSYNWLSFEFIRYKIRAYRYNKKWEKQLKPKKTIREMLKYLWKLIRKHRLLKHLFCKLKNKIQGSIWNVKSMFTRLRRKIRGCSTLEMQLIRNIGIEKGYDKCVFRRKIFEFVYTYLFFNGLKQYYAITQNAKRMRFKEFILYVYLHSIRLKMFGSEFKSIAALFDNSDIGEWDIDEFYIAILALTGAKVTPMRMVLYPGTVLRNQIDLNRALVWRNMIRDGRISEAAKESFKEDDIESVFYIINDRIVPFVECGIFYGPDKWPSYGEQNCWNFARTVYWYIWWKTFSNKTGTDDDLMKRYHSLAERTITKEHCKEYLSQAKPGAVVRICDDIKGNDRMGRNKHSQILLQHDENGVTIYESNDCNTGICYYTWDAYAMKYAKYKYFKYIKWPR